MVAGKRSRVKPRQGWEKDITDTFGTIGPMSTANSGGGQASISQIHLGSDVLTRLCIIMLREEKMNTTKN